jgi:hypothetical protein
MQFSPAAALWDNREALAKAMPEIAAVRAALETATGGPRDFIRQQWLQLASVVYDFKPDLIIELGRGYGNSTSAMAMAMKMLRPQPCRLLSLCLATSFNEISRPHLDATLPDKSLFASVEALNEDIARFDFSSHVEKAQRVFVFWDAHGYDLAMNLLARLFPALAEKAHLVLVHDMADLKYLGAEHRRYDGAPWKGTGSAPAKYILADVGCQYEEGVALVDFLGRNGLPFRSAESSYFSELTAQQVAEIDQRFGSDFSRLGFWYYFSLNEAAGRSLTFPSLPAEPAVTAPPATASAQPILIGSNQVRPRKKKKKKPSILRRMLARL